METLVRHRDEGAATWFLNSLVTTKATNDETGGGFEIAEHLVTPACNPPVHVHNDEEESFYVLDGELEVEVDGVVQVVRAGAFVVTPRGAHHTYRVLTETARMLVITSSPSGATNGGFADFIQQIGSPATARVLPEPEAPDPVRLTTVAADHGITILPPPGA